MSVSCALRPSVPVAKGEATSETKVSEKERRFPAPAGAVSSSPPLPGIGVSSGRASGTWTDLPPTLTPDLGSSRLLSPGHPSLNSTPPHGRSHPHFWSTPPPAPHLAASPNLHPSPALGGLGSLPRKQPRLQFPEAPPLLPKELRDWLVELVLSPSRLFQLHQLLSAKGRQGMRGPFLIGCRVRRPVPPPPCSRSAPGRSAREVLASLVFSDLYFQGFYRPHFPFIRFYLSEE